MSATHLPPLSKVGRDVGVELCQRAEESCLHHRSGVSPFEHVPAHRPHGRNIRTDHLNAQTTRPEHSYLALQTTLRAPTRGRTTGTAGGVPHRRQHQHEIELVSRDDVGVDG